MTNSEAILTVRGLTKSLGDGNTELVCCSPPFFLACFPPDHSGVQSMYSARYVANSLRIASSLSPKRSRE